MPHIYTSEFYENQMGDSRQSARECVPLIHSLTKPLSVIDVGCGVGAWLSVFRENGIEDLTGIDGSYVDRSLLLIPQDRFVKRNLAEPFSMPRQFDLALSLEVAEHLPPARAESFILDLTKLSKLIVFSAAIPGQGGTYHINEQWPPYWIDLFTRHGYIMLDCFRDKLWDRKNIVRAYTQNMFLFIEPSVLSKSPILEVENKRHKDLPLCLVHPDIWTAKIESQPTLRPLLHTLPRALSLAISTRLQRLLRTKKKS